MCDNKTNLPGRNHVKFRFLHETDPDSVKYSPTIVEFNPISPGGGIPPLKFFLHYPKTPQAIKLKLSNCKDTPFRHIL